MSAGATCTRFLSGRAGPMFPLHRLPGLAPWPAQSPLSHGDRNLEVAAPIVLPGRGVSAADPVCRWSAST